MSYAVEHQRLPWSNSGDEQLLWRACVISMLLLLALLSVLVGTYVVPEKDRAELEAIPPQLARLVKKTPPVKPVAAPAPKPVEKKSVPPTEQIKKSTPKALPKVKKVEAPKPVVKKSVREKPKKLNQTNKSTKQEIAKAKEVARSSGVLALQSQMSALTSVVSTSDFAGKQSSQSTSVTGVTKVSAVPANATKAMADVDIGSQKQVVTENTSLNDAESLRLKEREEERALALAEKNRGLTRYEEEIDLVVEGLRSTYRLLYSRAQRKDPFLEGSLVLSITIASEGHVSDVQVVSNSLSDDSFVSKLVARMKLTHFGESKAPAIQKTLTFDFIPS